MRIFSKIAARTYLLGISTYYKCEWLINQKHINCAEDEDVQLVKKLVRKCSCLLEYPVKWLGGASLLNKMELIHVQVHKL